MNSIKDLLDDFLTDSESGVTLLNREKLSKAGVLDSLYVRYTNKQKIAPTRIGVIEEISPYTKEFGKKRLWFLNNNKDWGLESGKIVASQDGINVVVNQGEYLNAGEVYSTDHHKEQPLKELVYLYKPTKLNRPSDNYFVYYYGDYLLNYSERQIIRFYFSLNPEKNKIKEFTEELSGKLNARKVPFTFKLPLELKNLERSDGMVLYIAQNHFHYVKDIVIEVYNQFSRGNSLFRESLPLFVLELKKGLGLAEDPMGEESFGMNLCKTILDLIKENENCKTVVDLTALLEEMGYKPGQWFRRPFTSFNYDISTVEIPSAYSHKGLLEGNSNYAMYNKLALDYSLDLVEKALWSSGSSFYWVTYEKKNGSEYYKVISEGDEDFDEIMWFLERLTRLPQNRGFFPKPVLDYIEECTGKGSFYNEKFLAKSMGAFIRGTFTGYSKIAENVFSGNTFKEDFKSQLNKVASWILQYLEPEKGGPIEADIYRIEIKYFNSSAIKELAKKIYDVYIKNQYPVKNEYGNYEYCPGIQGKLQVAMIMLFVYCPKLLEKN